MVAIRNESKKGTPIRKALGSVFQVSPEKDFELLRNQFLLVGLLERSEERIRAIEGLDHQKYLRYFPQARKGLVSAVLDHDSESFVAFRNGFADNVLQSIEFCALRLDEEVTEAAIPQEELNDLEARVKQVFDFTSETELDPRLREVSLDILAALRTALVDYRIRGIEGLDESIERSLGRLIMFYKRADTSNRESTREQVSRLLDLIVKFEAVVAKASSYVPVLAEWAGKLLGP